MHKLQLHRETLQLLDGQALDGVAGGYIPSHPCT